MLKNDIKLEKEYYCLCPYDDDDGLTDYSGCEFIPQIIEESGDTEDKDENDFVIFWM